MDYPVHTCGKNKALSVIGPADACADWSLHKSYMPTEQFYITHGLYKKEDHVNREFSAKIRQNRIIKQQLYCSLIFSEA